MPNPIGTERQPHAVLDHSSRINKAEKIASLVDPVHSLAGAKLVDIGCGGGMIASQLSALVGKNGEVIGVDVVDQRTVHDGYRFVQVSGTTLPFENNSIDIVVSNHCLEHVGDRRDQLEHLKEIRRVLADDGICYLALPNRWVLLEPHFRLPLLSWLPRPLRDPYVRVTGRGEFYDCDMPRPIELRQLFAAAGLAAEEVTVRAMRELARIESPSPLLNLILNAPVPVLRALSGIIPTKIYLLRGTS